MPSSFSENQVKELLTPHKPSTVKVKLPGSKKPLLTQRPFPSPVDWRDLPIYFLLIDRFNNPGSAPDSDPKISWDQATNYHQGGKFEGVRQRLSYIRNLGAGAIWLSPVLKNVQFKAEYSYTGYSIMDFSEVDPRFGTSPELAETELISLIDEAHARGLYIILDIVINHAGNLFAYDLAGVASDEANWSETAYERIYWRDKNGYAQPTWLKIPKGIGKDEGVWPRDFQNNTWFRRKGNGLDSNPTEGDFGSLKEFWTDLSDDSPYKPAKPVWDILIRAYQYLIAKFDVDGFRIDTFKHVEREFALNFSNAIREFAASIGKKNFFIFGEANTQDQKILAEYTGRYTSEQDGMIGADAVIDFPLKDSLVNVAKGFAPPTVVKEVFDIRKEVYKNLSIMSSHGEASRFFVTALDMHDQHSRFLYPKYGGDYSNQLTMAIGCLFCLQGIPCIYYGTEQGLKGTQELYSPNIDSQGGRFEYVREALWGKPNAFNQNHQIYKKIKAIAKLREREPALRYGRQYFREVSGNSNDFDFSKENGGIISFSRILNAREVVVVANTNTNHPFTGSVIVDNRINDNGTKFRIVYSNIDTNGDSAIETKKATFYKNDFPTSTGDVRLIKISLAPMEIQVFTNEPIEENHPKL
jgi:glycosidase